MKDNESRMIPAEQSLKLLFETLDDYNQFLTDVNNDKSIKDDYQKMAIVKKGYEKTLKNFVDDLNRIPSYEETLKKVTDEPNQHPSKNDEQNEINKLNSHMFGVETTTNDNTQKNSNDDVCGDNFEEFQKEDEKDNHKDNCKNSDKPWMTISNKFKKEHKIDNNEVENAIKIAKINNKTEEDKKENNNNEKNIDKLNIDELVEYINSKEDVKTKKKKKKKKKNKDNKKENDKIKTESWEDENDEVVEEFQEYITKHSINNGEIKKIKPCISQEWINSLA